MPYRAPSSFYAARRMKLSGQVYNRGDEIPVDVVAKMRKTDALLTYGWIVADADPWARKGRLTTPNPTALNPGSRKRLSSGGAVGGETVAVAPADPLSGGVSEILDWVGDDVDRAQQAWEAEVEREKPRSTLVKALESLLGVEDEE